MLFSKQVKSILATTKQSKMFSIMLPYVRPEITAEYIKLIVQQLNLGSIERIDIRPIGDHQQAFIHFGTIDETSEAIAALNQGQTLQVTCDARGHYWKMVKYVSRAPSPQARARACQMAKEREQREAEAIKASILAQEQRKFDEIMEELAAEQAHIDAVVAGKADYDFKPTPNQQADKVRPVIETLTNALSSQTLMTKEEKTALVRQFAAMMFYL